MSAASSTGGNTPGRAERIFVAGHRGLVGSALVRRLRAGGYANLALRTHGELELTDPAAVNAFFERERPAQVYLAAAKVGGILANDSYPAEFLYQNLMIQSNIIEAARRNGARKLLFLGSSCIYPKHAPQPMKEEYLLTGPLEPTNEAYAVAKIAGIKTCAAYNRQFGTDFLAVMPTNLYGPGDNYDPEGGHVVPALMRRMHEAKLAGSAAVKVWGTGKPLRELLYSDDLADAAVYLMERCGAKDLGEFVNVGTGVDLTIAALAAEIAAVVGFRGELAFDGTRPDGTPRKLLDCSRIHALGWKARTPLVEGLRLAYVDFLQHHEKAAHA
jgi:GDP-L-fucose synthase